MRIVLVVLLILAWHLATTAFVPTTAGKAWMFWPFASDTKSLLPSLVALPQQSKNPITPLLAGVASLCFIGAGLALFGLLVPAAWFRPLLLAAASASTLLFVLFFGLWSLLPIAVNAVLLWGALVQDWWAAAG